MNMFKKYSVMGILNITPDSFSDGGEFLNSETAIKYALKMESDGADIIDVGAQSTRPGAVIISPDEEIKRLDPVLKEITKQVKIPVSVDTFYSETTEFALKNGAKIINDVSGKFNRKIAELIKENNAGWIVMHNDKIENNSVEAVKNFFESFLKKAENFGIKKEQLCFDVGIGFNKTVEQNLALVKGCGKTKIEGCKLLIGASRKSFIGKTADIENPKDRLPGTVAAHTIAIMSGADIIRVHDVPEAVQAVKIIKAVNGIG